MTDKIAALQPLHDESLERYDAEIKRLEAELTTAARPHQGKIAKCLVRLIHERAVWRAQLEQISESPTQDVSICYEGTRKEKGNA
jgi:hypothetical protein